MTDALQKNGNGHALDRGPGGRFAPGNSVGKLGGRPFGFDLRKLAREKAEAEGMDLEDALWSVIKTMLAAAKKGDIQAAKLVLDKLGIDADPALIAQGMQVLVLTGVPSPDTAGLYE